MAQKLRGMPSLPVRVFVQSHQGSSSRVGGFSADLRPE